MCSVLFSVPKTAADPTGPEPTGSTEDPEITLEDIENNTNVEITPTPTLPPSSDDGILGAGLLGIVLAAVALLIVVLIGVSVLVCCIVCTWRARKKCPPASEDVQNYDGIDSHGLYTETASRTLATDRDQVSNIILGSLDPHALVNEEEVYYSSNQTSLSEEAASGRPQEYLTCVDTGRLKMTNNVAYWNHKELEDSGEYI